MFAPNTIIGSEIIRFSECTRVESPLTVKFPSTVKSCWKYTLPSTVKIFEPTSSTYKFEPTSSVCMGNALIIPTLEVVINAVVELRNSTVFDVALP